MLHLYKGGSIHGSTICPSAKNTSKIEAKSIDMILRDPLVSPTKSRRENRMEKKSQLCYLYSKQIILPVITSIRYLDHRHGKTIGNRGQKEKDTKTGKTNPVNWSNSLGANIVKFIPRKLLSIQRCSIYSNHITDQPASLHRPLCVCDQKRSVKSSRLCHNRSRVLTQIGFQIMKVLWNNLK